MSIISPNHISLGIDVQHQVAHFMLHMAIMQPCNPVNHPCAILGLPHEGKIQSG